MEAREAIAAAKAFVPIAFEGEEVSHVRLEEVEFDDRKNIWLITLGLARPTFSTRAGQILAAMGDGAVKRTYKVFEVENATGEVKGFKMRLFEE